MSNIRIYKGLIVLLSILGTHSFPLLASKDDVEEEAPPTITQIPPTATQTPPTALEETQTNESLRVKEQKEKGILREDRDYSEKSDFVKNRDRLEGATKKIGETIKDIFK